MSERRRIRLELTRAEASELASIAAWMQTTTALMGLYSAKDADGPRMAAHDLAARVMTAALETVDYFDALNTPLRKLDKLGDDLWLISDGGGLDRVHGISRRGSDGRPTAEVYCYQCAQAAVNSKLDPADGSRMDLDGWKFLTSYDLSGIWGAPICTGGCDRQWEPRAGNSDYGEWRAVPHDDDDAPDDDAKPEPPASGPRGVATRIDGNRIPINRAQARKIASHYGWSLTGALALDGARIVTVDIGNGVRIERAVTNAHPTKPISSYALTANELEAGPDWARKLTNAVKIARGL